MSDMEDGRIVRMDGRGEIDPEIHDARSASLTLHGVGGITHNLY